MKRHPKEYALDHILHSIYENEDTRILHLQELMSRRTGSTTREIDNMIQTLFNDGFVRVARPLPEKVNQYRDLWSRFLRRLSDEHEGLESFDVDHNRMSVRWVGFVQNNDINNRIYKEIENLLKEQNESNIRSISVPGTGDVREEEV